MRLHSATLVLVQCCMQAISLHGPFLHGLHDLFLRGRYVDPQHRGKGYSKKLLQRAKELAEATNSTGLLLETQVPLKTSEGFLHLISP